MRSKKQWLIRLRLNSRPGYRPVERSLRGRVSPGVVVWAWMRRAVAYIHVDGQTVLGPHLSDVVQILQVGEILVRRLQIFQLRLEEVGIFVGGTVKTFLHLVLNPAPRVPQIVVGCRRHVVRLQKDVLAGKLCRQSSPLGVVVVLVVLVVYQSHPGGDVQRFCSTRTREPRGACFASIDAVDLKRSHFRARRGTYTQSEPSPWPSSRGPFGHCRSTCSNSGLAVLALGTPSGVGCTPG